MTGCGHGVTRPASVKFSTGPTASACTVKVANGNTLITEGMHGRIFQVTQDGQVVWEYLTPYEDYAVAGEPEVKVSTVDGVDPPTHTPVI